MKEGTSTQTPQEQHSSSLYTSTAMSPLPRSVAGSSPSPSFDVDILHLWPFAALAISIVSFAQLTLGPWPPAPTSSEQQRLKGTSSKATRTSPALSDRLSDPRWWMYLALPIYALHQFEEHGFDVLGNRYAFQGWICESLVGPPFILSIPRLSNQKPQGYPSPPSTPSCPATALVIFFVNVIFVWGFCLLARLPPYSGAGANTYGLSTYPSSPIHPHSPTPHPAPWNPLPRSPPPNPSQSSSTP